MQALLFESRPDVDVAAVIDRISKADGVYLKFLSPNDLSLTGAHQDGVYLSKDCWSLFFDRPGANGENLSREINIKFDEGYVSDAVAHWYGKTKSEYRLTRLRQFKNREEWLGSLFVLARVAGEYFGTVLSTEDDINTLLNFLGISPAETGGLLKYELEERLKPFEDSFLERIGPGFPDTATFAREAQAIFGKIFGDKLNADAALLELVHIDYALFQLVERRRYEYLFLRPFENLASLLAVSLEISNRRKSRSGLSFEYHLRYIFERAGLPFSHGETTENKKKPDFLFPGIEAYRDPAYDSSRLFMLGAKTTCKDRWRQILDEADLIKRKHLVTLQHPFTSAQIAQMDAASVQLVVPKKYHKEFQAEDREFLMSLQEFIEVVAAGVDRHQGEPDLFGG